jgi:hypothetical protein
MIINLATIRDKETKLALKTGINEPKVFADILRAILRNEHLIDQDREHFWVFGLNNKKRIRYIELISLGTRSQTLADPSEVFRLAIMRGATCIICGHNHPSGDPYPSDEDRQIMQRLSSAGSLLGIKVLDLIIVSKDNYNSLAALEEIKSIMSEMPEVVVSKRPEAPLSVTNGDVAQGAYSHQVSVSIEKRPMIIGHFMNTDDASMRSARLLKAGDVSTIFEDLSNDNESLDKIEMFDSVKVLESQTSFLADNVSTLSNILSEAIGRVEGYGELVSFASDIEWKIGDVITYLKLLRDLPDEQKAAQGGKL